ncbi:aldolase II superfamily protein [compost metagenome]
MRAQAGGGKLVGIDAAIVSTAIQQAREVTRGAGGSLAWPALLRRLDRIDDSYKL